MNANLTAAIMLRALEALDSLLQQKVTLIVGGGGAMILAHSYPLATADIDAVPKGMDAQELDVHVKRVADREGLPGDWLNPYFSTFSYVLPADYEKRLIGVFSGRNLTALALGKEDLLIMKCFAHRQKDVGHARKLIRAGADLEIVEGRIQSLIERRIPGAQEALDFLDEVSEEA